MSRIIFFVLLIKTMFWSSGLNAQTFQTLNIDGFNQDVIANGIGTAATSTTSDVDGVSYAFKSIDWMLTSESSPQTVGFPVNGIINSEATPGVMYQLKDYSTSNSIQLKSSNPSIISNVSGSVKAKKLFVLVTSGSGVSSLTCKITFEDNTKEVFSDIAISDWYSGTSPAIAFRNFGRVGRMNNIVENSSSNPRLYEASLPISVGNENKAIKNIEFLRESSSGGVLNIFAVSAHKYINCPNPLAVTISDISGTTAKVNLTLPSVLPSSGYDYEVRTSGAPGSGAIGLVSSGAISFDSTTFKLTGLPPLRKLYFYIHSNCGATGVQDWMETISFVTNCETPKLIYTTSDNTCKNSAATLSADYDSGTIRWFDSSTSDTLLAVGNSFVTPNLSSSKSYWVEAMATEFLNSSGGKKDLHGLSNDVNTFDNWGIVFDLNQDVLLKSTDIFVGNYGTLNIAIKDNLGNELFSTGDISVNTSDIDKRATIPLNFKLTAGTGYRMVIKSFSGIKLFRDSSVSFPYKDDNDVLTVTSGFFDGFTKDYYYYFYNVTFEKECFSPRTEVIAKVVDVDAPIAAATQSFCASSNPTLNSIDIQGNGIQWYTTKNGGVPLPHTEPLEDDTTYYASQTIGTCTSETRTAVKIQLENPTLNVAGLLSTFEYGTNTQSKIAEIDSLTGNYPLTWFLNQTGGNSVPIPDIEMMDVGLHTYWVSGTVNGCESERIKIGLNITKALLTVTADPNQSKIYGDADPLLTYSVSGLKNNEQASDILTGSLRRYTGENVGMYSIRIGTLNAGTNYDIAFVEADFEITKATLTVTADSNQSKVYGEADPVFEYTVSGYKNGDTAAVLTGALSRDAGENVGVYAINQGTLSAGTNYDIAFFGADFEITKATLTVTADSNQSKVYGEADSVFGYTVSGYENGDTAAVLTGALSRDAGENVGVYAINQGTLSAGINYDIAFVGSDFEITKATLTVTVDSNQSKVYGEADPLLGYTVSGYKNGDTAAVLTGALSRDAGENVGVYAINQGTLSAGTNYDIAFIGADFEITKATLTVSANSNQSKVYGEADPVFGYTVSGYENGDTAAVLTGVLSRDAGENVGVYAINQGTLSAGTNYDIAFVGSDFEITKATLIVSANSNQSKVYGEADPVFGYTVSGYENGDTAAVLTGALSRDAGENVGVYAINQGTLSAGTNYDIAFVGADFEITKATLTVTADSNQSKVYGEADPVFRYTVSGYKNGDTAAVLTGALSRDAGENVGVYAINQGTLSAGTNYDIIFNSADFEITKAKLTVTVDLNQSKVYGEADPVFGYTVSGYENGDTAAVLTGALSRDAGENVGVYAINQGTLNAGTSYNIVFVGADFEITKATLIITANTNQVKAYGDIDPVFGYTVSGYENGDTAAILTGALSRDAGENAGAYEINLGSLITNANYDIQFVTGLFTIIKAKLTVKADPNQSKVYGDVDPDFEYTVSGYKNGDTATILTGVLNRDAGENVGVYTIKQGTLSAGINYDIIFNSADFEITKAILTVTVDTNQSKIFGDIDPVFGYTVSGYENGDTVAVLTGALSRNAGENVGVYTINQGTLSAGMNYDIIFNNADFEITKAILTVTVDTNQSKIFGDVDPVFGYTVSGFKNGDTAAVLTGALSRDAGENVGVYAIKQGTLTANVNYDLTFIGADFEITKATVKGVVLNDATFGYDGTTKSLVINGTLPLGTSVSYQNNSHVNLGSYAVTATIDGGVNYFDLVLDAVLTIEKGTIKGIAFSNVAYTYDGTLKSLAINGILPAGTSVSYVNNGHIDAGDYPVTALIDGGVNYNDLTLKAILTIKKAPIAGLTFDNASFVYDGNVKSLAIQGVLPTGVSVTYQGNNKIDAGIYTVTASLNGGNNYLSLNLTARLTIEKASQVLSFNVDSPIVLEDVVDYQLNASASSGLKVEYTYSYNTDTPAAIVSETGWLEFKHPGIIQITVQQGGNKNYHAASAITKTLVVESRDASIHKLNIDGIDFEKPSDEVVYTLDCNDLKNEVLVRIQTQLGAMVEPSHEFVVSVPNPGIYRNIVSITSQNGQVVKQYVIRIEKPFLFSYIAEQKYDNVLLINNNPKTNGGYKFVKFEWYKNGELIGDKQTYSAGNRPTDILDKSAEYHAVLTTDSGDVLLVCPTEILLKHQYNTKLYPSPAKAGNSITVSITYPLSQLQGERLDIFDMSGKRIISTTISGERTELLLPSSLQAGTYIATFKLNGQHKVIHFTVE